MSAAFPPSLWAEVAVPRAPASPLRGEVEAEVVVVGAGFTGLSAALHLARRGVAPIVVEAHAVGWGASGRNNGQVIPTLTAAEPDAMALRWGEAGERFARLVGGSAAYLFDTVREEGIEAEAEAEAEQTGWFQPAHSPGRIRISEGRVAAWQRLGFPAELLDRAACEAMLGTDFWFGGMFNPTGGHVNPLGLARGLATAAERRGATIHEGSPVTAWTREGEGWRVRTAQGSVRARALILATNAYTDLVERTLASRISRQVVPVLSWQMATTPLGDNLRAKVLPGRQAVSDTSGDLRFFRYDARNRMITGGAVIGGWRAAERVRNKAARRLAEAFPDMGVPEMSHVWSGYIGMTWDRFPCIHRLGPDGWTWTGCNGRGVALSVSLGREIAAAVTGTAERDLALPLSDPAPLPFPQVARRVAPAYLAWLRRKDRIEIAND
ncbi:NAD(P)/FAD-dependent oxidoreductase [Roseitranquillus sediminis]|uniref:NAD(P)/FAD-dependent oxidoreductase n=1 Tax=Roseitranquillus sediminis TaxID=2809051 RepID=UPI001D0C0A7F|nr:FAD-dependent oxidoreductase [Roseitranquillus sediminis]MBM9595980.1 FAD-binding oxidoreductase [Roseitranquillus sediminis]